MAEATFKSYVLSANGITYEAEKPIGTGSFGVVVKAVVSIAENPKIELRVGDTVAIKKVLQDKKYKNRELQIMTKLSHANIVKLYDSFLTAGSKADQVYLNLVLEFIPDTVYNITRFYTKNKERIPLTYVRAFGYQLLLALAYTHSQGVCHRDIKPQNLLVNHETGVLKLCDFGSAKMLVAGEPNVSYICSRYYRAPELIFDATEYTNLIDSWSAGCVIAELLLGRPLFVGRKGVEQLVEIMKVLGTPTIEQIYAMNPKCAKHDFPKIKSRPWARVIKNAPDEALDLIDKLLRYVPTERLSTAEASRHPFFEPLRDPTLRLPNGNPLPPLEGIVPWTNEERELAAQMHHSSSEEE